MKHLRFLTLIIFLVSCNESDKLYLTFDNIEGLNTGASAYIRGLEVGHVSDIYLSNNYKIIAELELKRDLKLPVDSKIEFQGDFLGNRSIAIFPGDSEEYINPGDTINAGLKVENPITSPIGNIINSFVDFADKIDSLNLSKQDSLLIEIRRLNRNLERLTNE